MNPETTKLTDRALERISDALEELSHKSDIDDALAEIRNVILKANGWKIYTRQGEGDEPNLHTLCNVEELPPTEQWEGPIDTDYLCNLLPNSFEKQMVKFCQEKLNKLDALMLVERITEWNEEPYNDEVDQQRINTLKAIANEASEFGTNKGPTLLKQLRECPHAAWKEDTEKGTPTKPRTRTQ